MSKQSGALDVLEVDAADGGLQRLAEPDDVLGVGRVDFEVEDVDVGERLEEDALAFHHRLAGERPDVAQPEHRGAVRDHGHEVAAGGVAVGVVGPLGDGQAGDRPRPACRPGRGRAGCRSAWWGRPGSCRAGPPRGTGGRPDSGRSSRGDQVRGPVGRELRRVDVPGAQSLRLRLAVHDVAAVAGVLEEAEGVPELVPGGHPEALRQVRRSAGRSAGRCTCAPAAAAANGCATGVEVRGALAPGEERVEPGRRVADRLGRRGQHAHHDVGARASRTRAPRRTRRRGTRRASRRSPSCTRAGMSRLSSTQILTGSMSPASGSSGCRARPRMKRRHS